MSSNRLQSSVTSRAFSASSSCRAARYCVRSKHWGVCTAYRVLRSGVLRTRQAFGTVLPSPGTACLMVSLTGTAGAAAPQRAAASSTAAMTAGLTKGRAASCTATSSPWAASTPFLALSARVAPPATICTGLVQPTACCSTKARFLPATSTISPICGHWSKARMLRCSTVSPPRSKLSLSNPIRVEEPAATSTAEIVFCNLHTCPCCRRAGVSGCGRL